MAEWVSEGAPSLDLWPLDVRRFGVHHNSTRFLEARTGVLCLVLCLIVDCVVLIHDRTVEVYGSYYKLHPPGVELKSGRPLRTSPLYQTLKVSCCDSPFSFSCLLHRTKERCTAASLAGSAPTGLRSTDTRAWSDPRSTGMFRCLITQTTTHKHQRKHKHRPNWFDAVGAEHKAVRERVALIDQSSFAKLEGLSLTITMLLLFAAVCSLSHPVIFLYSCC